MGAVLYRMYMQFVVKSDTKCSVELEGFTHWLKKT